MTKPQAPSLAKIARMFGCTIDQVRTQFRGNAADARAAAVRAGASHTGKASGKTAAQWLDMAATFDARANEE